MKRLLNEEEDFSDWGLGGDVQVQATTYVDVQRTPAGKIERKYVVWVKKAIEDGQAVGMPMDYAEKYIMPFMPIDGRPLEDIMMVRTTKIGEHSAGIVPRGFASWSRG